MTKSAEPSTPSGSSETQQRRRQITSYKNTTTSPATDTAALGSAVLFIPRRRGDDRQIAFWRGAPLKDSARGYIAMPRSIFGDASFAQEPFTERDAFLSLVADAAWKPRRVRLKRGAVDLLRGQLLGSSRFLAERWKWPEPRVRRFLERISGRRANDAQGDAPNDAHGDALIDALPTSNGTIITIRDYDVFQKEAKS